MWLIKSPKFLFNEAYTYQENLEFQLIAIIPVEKYVSFPLQSRTSVEENSAIIIKEVQIKNPNKPDDPQQYIPCKLITYRLK